MSITFFAKQLLRQLVRSIFSFCSFWMIALNSCRILSMLVGTHSQASLYQLLPNLYLKVRAKLEQDASSDEAKGKSVKRFCVLFFSNTSKSNRFLVNTNCGTISVN